jgi:putative redox protein
MGAGVMKAEVRYGGDEFMVGTSQSGNSIVMDTKGDRKSAPTPMELLLLAAAGCTMVDVVSIMEKKRQEIVEYRIEVIGDRRDEHPRSFTKMHLNHIVKGRNINLKGLEDAIKLSDEKYCSVAATLRPGCEIETSYEVIEVE